MAPSNPTRDCRTGCARRIPTSSTPTCWPLSGLDARGAGRPDRSQALRKRTAILISGRGSNMAALLAAAADPAYPASVALVLSNRADAPGLERAAAAGVPTA